MFCVFGCYKFSAFWQAIAGVYSRVDRTFSIHNRAIHATNQPTNQPVSQPRHNHFISAYLPHSISIFSRLPPTLTHSYFVVCVYTIQSCIQCHQFIPMFQFKGDLFVYVRAQWLWFLSKSEMFYIWCGFFSAWWQIIVAKIWQRNRQCNYRRGCQVL